MAKPVVLSDGGELLTDSGDAVPSSAFTNIDAIAAEVAANPALTDVFVADTGNQTIAGVKTFSSDPIIPDEVYGAGWNATLEPPTKNAVYDKVETLAPLASPALSGTPTAPTAAVGDNDTSLATTAFVSGEAWIAPTYTNSWVDNGGVYQAGRYRKRATEVDIEGTIKSGASGTSAFTLPAGYRPSGAHVLPIVTSTGGHGLAQINADGTVVLTQITGVITDQAFLGRLTFSTL